MAGTRNQIKGGMGYVRGRVQCMVGKLTHNRSMQARGAGNQVKGGVRFEAGKAQGARDTLTTR
jgi:uncharacterized protein YjbJ (UPF0337 family)